MSPWFKNNFGRGETNVSNLGFRTITVARTLDHLDVAGKRVLVRGDLSVPMRDGVLRALSSVCMIMANCESKKWMRLALTCKSYLTHRPGRNKWTRPLR